MIFKHALAYKKGMVNKKVPSDTLMLSKGTMYFHSPRFHPFCFFKPLHRLVEEEEEKHHK